jgi:serine phosphatase RsbU (regulator of sigma subunit)
LSRDVADLERVAATINTELIRDNNEAMSVTMLLGVLDLTNGSVRLVCAGHEDPIRVTTDHIATRHPLSGGPPFSIVEFNYPVETLTLRPGEALLLVTDGITEAQNASGALYGRDRILTDVSFAHGHAAEICEAIRDDVRQFEEGTEATDDLTIMVLRYLGETVAA